MSDQNSSFQPVREIVEQKPILVQKPGRMELSSEFTPVKRVPEDKTEIDWERVGWQALGGVAGGAAAAGATSGLATPIGVGLGSSIAGQAYDLIRELQGYKEKEPLMDRSIKAAEEALLDIIFTGGTAKGLDAIKQTVRTNLKTFRKGAPLTDYAAFNIRPSAGAVTGNRSIQSGEKALSEFTFSAAPMQEAAEESLEQTGQAVTRLARSYGPIRTTEEIGTVLKKGAQGAVEKFEATAENLFSRVVRDVGAETPVPVKTSLSKLQEILGRAQRGPVTGLTKFSDDFVKKAEGGQLPYEALRRFRTRVGELLKDPQLVASRDIGQGELKELYGAMTQDLTQAAGKAGPKTLAKFNAANKYYRTAMETKIPILDEILRKGYDEEALTVAMRSAESGSGRLQALKRQMTGDEWDTLAGTVLGRMGKAVPSKQDAAGEVFSISTFMTRWNKISPEAKTVLFGSQKNQPLRIQLDRLTQIVGDFKDVERMANVSRSGSTAAFLGLLVSSGAAAATGGFAVGVKTLGLGAAVPYAAAKLITNPKFVKWLATGAQILKTNPNSLLVHIGRLAELAKDDEIKDYVKDLAEASGLDQWAPDLRVK